jgi:hypothetical protein
MRPIIREEWTQRLASDWVKVMAGEIPLPEEPLQDERPILLEALSRLSLRNRRIIRWLMIEELSDAEIRHGCGSRTARSERRSTGPERHWTPSETLWLDEARMSVDVRR